MTRLKSPALLMILVLWIVSINIAISVSEGDRYEAIAISGFQQHQSKLDIIEPPVLPELFVESLVNNPGLPAIQYSRMETRKQFQEELERLKVHYKPFLADRTPRQLSTRTRYELTDFQFRYEEKADRTDISRVFAGKGNWKNLTIPHYTGPLGWWRAYYRKELNIPQEVLMQDVQILHFGAVSYECDIYLNGRLIHTNVGWFAPFKIDITEFINRTGSNLLVVEIRNEVPPQTGGNRGRKIFAATSPGWDDPYRGWHCDQSGGGIWQTVYIEGRPQISITDIFVRPNIDEDYIDVLIEVFQPAFYKLIDGSDKRVSEPVDISVSIYPKNFSGEPFENITIPTSYSAESLYTEYLARIPMKGYKLWTPETPYLYSLVANVSPRQHPEKKDIKVSHFGMRTFHMGIENDPKGTLYLNNEKIHLRGANHMGHFQRAIMEGNLEQVVEDILIGKMANMNYWRLTQSPCQPEFYDIADRLGMMVQTDLPLFEHLSRCAFEEALKQVGEMEKLVRNHPSNIMISYINETNMREHENRRTLNRDELEVFFKAATKVVHMYNPDRVVKEIDGDFFPPPPGFPDIHYYSLWYGSGWLPWGKMHRGYIITGKPGWKWGTGEYSAGEGLDSAETMFQHYPRYWLPNGLDDPWTPDKIALAQTWRTHLQWYDTQETMRDWITASHRHQAWGTRMMTRNFRRFENNVSSAIHLLIDAWPSGWMKTLVDVNRFPKKAYFEFRDALTPLMTDIRMDRTRYFSGEPIDVEFWLYNDKKAPFEKGTLQWEVWSGDERIFAQSKNGVAIPSYAPGFAGYFNLKTPIVSERSALTVKLALLSKDGGVVHATEEDIEVFPRTGYRKSNQSITAMIANDATEGHSVAFARAFGLKVVPFRKPYNDADIILIDHLADLEAAKQDIIAYIEQGGKALVFNQSPGVDSKGLPNEAAITIGPYRLTFREFPHRVGREFVSRKTGHPLVEGFEPHDFGFWFNPKKGHIDYICTAYVEFSSDAAEPDLVDFASDAMKFNFGPADSAIDGYTLSYGNVFDERLGYGWSKALTSAVRKRNSGKHPVLDTGITVGPRDQGVFSVRLDNGRYCITPIVGDASYATHNELSAQHNPLGSYPLEAGKWTARSFSVNVTDGMLNLTLGSGQSGVTIGQVLNGLIVEKWTPETARRVLQQEKVLKEQAFYHVLETGYGPQRYAALGELKLGDGSMFFSQLESHFDSVTNPIYNQFYQQLIEY